MWNSQAKYIARNASVLNVTNPKLYTTARVNPLSLKYYGLCLWKGKYIVNLHFAEIIYTDDNTYSSIGKRLFDVSIQVINCVFAFLGSFNFLCIYWSL